MQLFFEGERLAYQSILPKSHLHTGPSGPGQPHQSAPIQDGVLSLWKPEQGWTDIGVGKNCCTFFSLKEPDTLVYPDL